MTKRDSWAQKDYVFFAIIMSLMGGFYWAIRGTGGYGGETGAIVAGAGWATWWYFASQRGADGANRPYGSAWALVAITFGVMFGGYTGYGVWISWLRGVYHYDRDADPTMVRDIDPWIGFFMLFLSGLQWGGLPGCFLAWCASVRKMDLPLWIARIGCGIGGGALAVWFLNNFPHLHLPFHSEGIYDNLEWKSVQRTRNQIMPVGQNLGIVAGFLLFEAARRDWRAVRLIVTMALGFGISFSVGAIWHLFEGSGLRLGWWKHWEMSIGLGGGAAFGLAFWLFNRPGDTARATPSPRALTVFSLGGPLWMVLVIVCWGAYDGLTRQYDATASLVGLVALGVLCLVPVFARWRGERMLDLYADGRARAWLPVVVVQGAIVICGLLVSFAPGFRLANAVIVAAYAVYLLVSAHFARKLFA